LGCLRKKKRETAERLDVISVTQKGLTQLRENLASVPTKYGVNEKVVRQISLAHMENALATLQHDKAKNGNTEIPKCAEHSLLEIQVNSLLPYINACLRSMGEPVLPEIHTSILDIINFLKALVGLCKLIYENINVFKPVGNFLLQCIATIVVVLYAILRFLFYDAWLMFFFPCCQTHSTLISDFKGVMDEIWR